MNTTLPIHVLGEVTIKDSYGNVLLQKTNAIHSQNMARAIARGLANAANYSIFKIKLGNQGTYIDGTQQIIFRPANTTGDSADLYNPTYAEIVDDTSISVGVGNSVTFTDIPATTNTRVIITAVISSDEAINNATDTNGPALNPEGNFFFDELGLFTKQTSGDTPADILNGAGEMMLTHLIFSPIEHTGNREITIVYSLTVSVS